MHQPSDFVDLTKPNHVCLLSKALYDLKQSPYAWFQTLILFLVSIGFSTSRYDPFLFTLHSHGQTITILVYVDDIIITSSHSTMVDQIIAKLQSKFPIKDLGNLSFFLGIEVQQTPNGLHLSQSRYITNILAKVHMEYSNPVPSPMTATHSLFKFDGDPFDHPTLYRTIVGGLQYATIT
jgi:Reverse transcriptase (RNA-dependent DNA polymerase)